MDFGSINWVAVLLATLVSFVSGFIWFGPKTFYPVWWKALGKSPNTEPGSQQSMAVVFGSITVALFVQSLVFSVILSWYGAKTGDLTAASGALAGLIVGVGIVAASPLSHRLMGQHGFKVWILEAGNDALNYVLMGLVFGAMLQMATKFNQSDPMYDKIMAAHDAAVSAGLTEYKDPKTGFSVMTEPFLKAKGFCCKNDCRHCPYPA